MGDPDVHHRFLEVFVAARSAHDYLLYVVALLHFLSGKSPVFCLLLIFGGRSGHLAGVVVVRRLIFIQGFFQLKHA